MKFILDDIKAKNEERRKKKENKIKKYTDEIRQKKVRSPAAYGSMEPSKNFAYSNPLGLGYSGAHNPYTRFSNPKNIDYGVVHAPKNPSYGVISPPKGFHYGAASPGKVPAYGVISATKTPGYGSGGAGQNFSASAGTYGAKRTVETPTSSGPDYYNKQVKKSVTVPPEVKEFIDDDEEVSQNFEKLMKELGKDDKEEKEGKDK